MYLIEHPRTDLTRYEVRALDVRSGRVRPGVIADKVCGEWRMEGVPVTRIQRPGGDDARGRLAAIDTGALAMAHPHSARRSEAKAAGTSTPAWEVVAGIALAGLAAGLAGLRRHMPHNLRGARRS